MIFTIEVSEDGDVYVRAMSEEEFEQAVNTEPDDEWSGVDPIDPTQLRDNTMIVDPMYWNDSSGRILAIRGEIVKVTAVARVQKWEAK